MSRKLVIGNWKMNPSSLDEARKIVRRIRSLAGTLTSTDVVACPPYVFIPAALSRRDPDRLRVGAQTVSYEESGPHTGEVSAAMLAGLGVQYVIVGHSEERAAGDTDELVSRRAKAVLDVGMKVILCVGERVRDEGGAYLDDLKEQIKNSLMGIPFSQAKNIILAYEPVWAIGAKEAMQPQHIYETSLFIRKVFSDIFSQHQAMKALVLYGGSVNFRNAADIITVGQVDGLLVGRESVNLPGFVELLKAVDAC